MQIRFIVAAQGERERERERERREGERKRVEQTWTHVNGHLRYPP